jgi:dTDP-glucose 4,6-dehydratase
MRKNSIKRLVSISSVEVYGDTVSIDENSNLDPQNPYATSKAAADIVCGTYFKMYKTPVVILRLVNQYGPNQNSDKLIPKLIKNVIEKKPMKIFGDGKKYKCWAYVFDSVETIWQAGIRTGIEGQIYNLGGEEATVIQIAQIISNNMKQFNPKIEFVDDKIERISVHSFKTKKAEEHFGWEIKTPLEVGIKKTIEWYLKTVKWLL